MFDIHILPMNLSDGKNLGALPGLFAFVSPKMAISKRIDKQRAEDIVIFLIKGRNQEISNEKLTQWASFLSDTYFTRHGSFTLGISTAIKELKNKLDKSETADTFPQLNIVFAVIRKQTLVLAHLGSVHTTILFSDHTEYYHEENDEPFSSSNCNPRYYQTEIHPGDLILLSSELPSGWNNEGIIEATGESPLNVIRYLLDQSDGNLESGVIQLKAGSGNIYYRNKLPIITKVQPEFAHRVEQRTTIHPVQQETSESTEAKPLYRSRKITNLPDDFDSSETEEIEAPALLQEGSEIEQENENEPSFKNIETPSREENTVEVEVSEDKTLAPEEKTEEVPDTNAADETENGKLIKDQEETKKEVQTPTSGKERKKPRLRPQVPRGKKLIPPKPRNWKRFFLVLSCGLLIPAVVVATLFFTYSDRSKTKKHRDYLNQAAQAAEIAYGSQSVSRQEKAWLDVFSLTNKAFIYGTSHAADELHAQALFALDNLADGKKVTYYYGNTNLLPANMKLVHFESSGQYTYALDTVNSSIFRFVANGSGMGLDPQFSCQPGTYPNRSYNEANSDEENTNPSAIAVGPLVDFVLLPGGNTHDDVLAAFDKNANILYCSTFTENTASALKRPNGNLSNDIQVFFTDDKLYLLDRPASAIWTYHYNYREGFNSEPETFFGSHAPNLTDIIDFAILKDHSFFIRDDNSLMICDYTAWVPDCQNIKELSNENRSITFDLTHRYISKLFVNQSPDNSIYLADEKMQTLINLTAKGNFVRYIVPNREKSDSAGRSSATGFGITGLNRLIWAYNNSLYLGNLP